MEVRFSWKRLLITTGIVILAAGAVGTGVWYMMDSQAEEDKEVYENQIEELQAKITNLSQKDNSSKSKLTNDEIFNEVSEKLSFTRAELTYFRIFSQDKVSYAKANSGPFFAYKVSGEWNLVPEGGSSAIIACSKYESVPKEFRPICNSSTSGLTLENATADRTSINFPVKDMVSYIGE